MPEYLDYKIQMKLKQDNYKYLNILICILGLFLCYGFSTYAQPPFTGTAYVDKDIIRKNDPSDFISLEYIGLVKENPYDYRADTWMAQDMFVFNVKYKHKKGTRVRVNTEFGNAKNAQRQAERYAFVVGQMPLVLLRDVDTITVHKGEDDLVVVIVIF